MTQNRVLARGDPLPEQFPRTIQEIVGTYRSPNFKLNRTAAGQFTLPATTGNGQVSVAINGKHRYNTANVIVTHPGGSAGLYNIWVTASNNAYLAGPPEVDSTVYAFGLEIRPTGSTPTTDLSRVIGTCYWDGGQITHWWLEEQTFPAIAPTPALGDSLVWQAGLGWVVAQGGFIPALGSAKGSGTWMNSSGVPGARNFAVPVLAGPYGPWDHQVAAFVIGSTEGYFDGYVRPFGALVPGDPLYTRSLITLSSGGSSENYMATAYLPARQSQMFTPPTAPLTLGVTAGLQVSFSCQQVIDDSDTEIRYRRFGAPSMIFGVIRMPNT